MIDLCRSTRWPQWNHPSYANVIYVVASGLPLLIMVSWTSFAIAKHGCLPDYWYASAEVWDLHCCCPKIDYDETSSKRASTKKYSISLEDPSKFTQLALNLWKSIATSCQMSNVVSWTSYRCDLEKVPQSHRGLSKFGSLGFHWSNRRHLRRATTLRPRYFSWVNSRVGPN